MYNHEILLRLGQKLRIGNNRVIQVSAISGGRAANDESEITFGIQAPKNVLVYTTDANNNFKYSKLGVRKMSEMREGYREQITLMRIKLTKMKELIKNQRDEILTLKKTVKAANQLNALNAASTKSNQATGWGQPSQVVAHPTLPIQQEPSEVKS